MIQKNFRRTSQEMGCDRHLARMNKQHEAERISYLKRARPSKGYAIPEECKEKVLGEIDAEFNHHKQDHKKLESIKSEQWKVEILRQSVPDSPGRDRLLL
jgi:hypothetical protein